MRGAQVRRRGCNSSSRMRLDVGVASVVAAHLVVQTGACDSAAKDPPSPHQDSRLGQGGIRDRRAHESEQRGGAV